MDGHRQHQSPWSTPRKSEYGEGFLSIEDAANSEEVLRVLTKNGLELLSEREMGDGEPSKEGEEEKDGSGEDDGILRLQSPQNKGQEEEKKELFEEKEKTEDVKKSESPLGEKIAKTKVGQREGKEEVKTTQTRVINRKTATLKRNKPKKVQDQFEFRGKVYSSKEKVFEKKYSTKEEYQLKALTSERSETEREKEKNEFSPKKMSTTSPKKRKTPKLTHQSKEVHAISLEESIEIPVGETSPKKKFNIEKNKKVLRRQKNVPKVDQNNENDIKSEPGQSTETTTPMGTKKSRNDLQKRWRRLASSMQELQNREDKVHLNKEKSLSTSVLPSNLDPKSPKKSSIKETNKHSPKKKALTGGFAESNARKNEPSKKESRGRPVADGSSATSEELGKETNSNDESLNSNGTNSIFSPRKSRKSTARTRARDVIKLPKPYGKIRSDDVKR